MEKLRHRYFNYIIIITGLVGGSVRILSPDSLAEMLLWLLLERDLFQCCILFPNCIRGSSELFFSSLNVTVFGSSVL